MHDVHGAKVPGDEYSDELELILCPEYDNSTCENHLDLGDDGDMLALMLSIESSVASGFAESSCAAAKNSRGVSLAEEEKTEELD